jgi:cytoskeletal protein RodZ
LEGKNRAVVRLILLAFLLCPVGVVTARSQSAPQTGDPSKSDSNATKNSANTKKSGTAAQTPASSTSGNSTPVSPSPTAQQASPAKGGGMVWVSTASGVYHKPGSRYYGKTKQWKYMTEADAKKAGYHAAAKE